MKTLVVRFVALLLALSAVSMRAQAPPPPLMPMPSHLETGDGQFLIDGKISIALQGYTEPRLTLARDRFLATLSRETGIPMTPDAPNRPANFTIKTTGASKPVQQLDEDESYHLTVSSTGVQLTAPNPLGVLHGLQTFLQLVRITPQGFATPT